MSALQAGPAPASAHNPALDALRAGAMLLGVALHACAPYMKLPQRGLIMPLQQPAPSAATDAAFWIVHLFRVPLFCVIAGVAASRLLARRGTDEFLRDRWRRLGVPILLAYPLFVLVIHPIWLWGWVRRGWASWHHFGKFKYGPELQRAVWGLDHLWFLQYILLYCVLLWAWERASRGRVRVSGIARSVFALAAPVVCAACVALDPGWFIDFRNGYLPDPAAFVYYGLFFFAGVACSEVICASRFAPRTLLTFALPAFALGGVSAGSVLTTLPLSQVPLPWGPSQGLFESDPATRRVLGACVSATAWLWSAGFIALALATVTRLARAGRFLADASYWVYLSHLPWVGLCVMLLSRAAIRPEFKAAIATCVSAAVSLATYTLLRNTYFLRTMTGAPPVAPK